MICGSWAHEVSGHGNARPAGVGRLPGLAAAAWSFLGFFLLFLFLVGPVRAGVPTTAAMGDSSTVAPVPRDPERVVVRVGNESITEAEIERAVQTVRRSRTLTSGPNVPEDSLRTQAIEKLVSQRLLELEARKAGLEPTEREASDFIKGFWPKRFPSEDSFIVALHRLGLTKEQFAADWRRNTGVNKLVLKTVQDTVKVTPEQAQAYYDSHREEFAQPERARARHILLRVPEGSAPEASAAIKAKIDSIATRIKEGADFGQLAEKNSEDPGSKVKGGDLGLFRRGQMVAPFDSVAFALAPGTVSGPVRTRFGWHLIKTEEIVPPGPAPFAEVKDRLTAKLTQMRVRAIVDAWIVELKQKTRIER
jgi:hypothetical protein